MKLSNKILGSLAFVCATGAVAATGYITQEHTRILNSTVDATPIGTSQSASGYFTAFGANTGVFNSSLLLGGGYSGFTLTPSGSAPARRGMTWGADPAGDITLWLNSAETNPILRLIDGNSGTQYFTAGPNGITSASGATITGTTNTNTLGVTGNISAGGSLSVGNGATVTGALNTNSLGVSGNGSFSGVVSASAFNGNASSSSQLNHTPTTCANSRLIGISANGNAVCTLSSYSIPVTTTSVCSTGSGTYNTCTTTVPFSGFGDGTTNYSVVCNGVGANDPRAQLLSVNNSAATSFTATLVTEGSVAVTFSALSCTVTHY